MQKVSLNFRGKSVQEYLKLNNLIRIEVILLPQ